MALLLMLVIITAIEADSTTSPRPLFCLHGKDVIDKGVEFSNGSLKTSDGFYPRGTWGRFNKTLEVCKCIARPCFRKCCEEWEGELSTNFTCFNVTDDQRDASRLRPSVHHEKGLETFINTNDSASFHNHFEVLYGKPCPGRMYRIEPNELEDFHLLRNGKLRAWGGEEMHDVFGYCFEVMLDTSVVIPILCVPSSPTTQLKFTLYAIGMAISAPFLATTFVIYAMIPQLHTVNGRSQMSHVLALLAAYISLPIAHLYQGLTVEGCMALAFIIYFSFLASFFWLNVMCLDIWWTFSGYRPMRGSVKEREHKKFIIYSLYCWGSPLIMLIICMVMDLHPDIPNSYHKPGFGETKCWFKSNTSNLIYFSGPIAILIVCNIVLFILTAIKIRQVKRGTKILTKQDSRRHNEEEENNAQRFNLYFKLFLVMGVNWIMEIISFAAGGPDEWWYITDIANTLQGVLIFIIFVWKDRIRRLLIERFCPNRAANNNSVDQTSSTRTTTIRNNIGSKSRVSFKNKEAHAMNKLTSSPSVISDDSDVP